MLSVGFKTDKGRLREGNEDSLFVLPEEQLYIVADGVGGQNSGELASRLFIGYVAQYVAINRLSNVKGELGLKNYFKSCMRGANGLIYEKAVGGNFGMATTAVMCHVRKDRAYIINVGDSRAYLLRDGKLLRVTEDHTVVRDMLIRGLITEEEAEDLPEKNMITRAVGGDKKIKPDFFSFDIYPNDILILCSDGLYGELTDDEITRAAYGAFTMHGLATDLVRAANEHGGRDNISVICVKVR